MSSTDLSGALWRKSSYSNGQANCVEVATSAGGHTSWPSATAKRQTASA